MDLLSEVNFDNEIWIINYSTWHRAFRVHRYANPKDALAWVENEAEAISWITRTYPEWEIILLRLQGGKTKACLNSKVWKRVTK